MSNKLDGQVLDLVPVGRGGKLEKSEANQRNQAFAGGIKDSSDFLPVLGLRGRQFRIKSGGQEVSLEDRHLDVILVAARTGLSKQYYAGDFQPGTVRKPDCQSIDGIRPDPGVANPINDLCATCRMNAWGSRKNTVTGKDAKACNDTKLVVLAPPSLDADKPLQLSLPVASHKNLSAYIKLLNHNGLAANEVVTRLKFTDDAFPKLEFNYVKNLTADQATQVAEIAIRDDVQVTLNQPAQPKDDGVAPATSTQPTEVAHVPEKSAAPAPTPAPTATVTPDQPSDEITNVLSRWGASPAK